MSKLIKSIDSNVLISSNQKPPRSGAFEVTINKEVVFSKLKNGSFPNKEQVNSWFDK